MRTHSHTVFVFIASIVHRTLVMIKSALHLLEVFFWVYSIASWCMCFYVYFASAEGLRWFLTFNNYLLIFGATIGLSLLPFRHVPLSSIIAVHLIWSFYAILVSAHYWHYKLWSRQIIPVNLPLVFLFIWTMTKQMSDMHTQNFSLHI